MPMERSRPNGSDERSLSCRRGLFYPRPMEPITEISDQEGVRNGRKSRFNVWQSTKRLGEERNLNPPQRSDSPEPHGANPSGDTPDFSKPPALQAIRALTDPRAQTREPTIDSPGPPHQELDGLRKEFDTIRSPEDDIPNNLPVRYTPDKAYETALELSRTIGTESQPSSSQMETPTKVSSTEGGMRKSALKRSSTSESKKSVRFAEEPEEPEKTEKHDGKTKYNKPYSGSQRANLETNMWTDASDLGTRSIEREYYEGPSFRDRLI